MTWAWEAPCCASCSPCAAGGDSAVAISWVTSMPPAVPFPSLVLTTSELVPESCWNWARDVHVRGCAACGVRIWPVVAVGPLLVPDQRCQVHTMEKESFTPYLWGGFWVPVHAEHPVIQALSTLQPPATSSSTHWMPWGCRWARAAGGAPDLCPSLALPSMGCWGWSPFSFCPCHGPGNIFGSLLLSLHFLYASFLFKCHRSLHQLISLYMYGI